MNTNQPKSMLYITMGLSVFIGYLAYTYPVALGIYWFSFSLIGIVEQLLIKKVFLRKHVEEINAMKK
jgi:membrane protein insertase Oxa1/YidC/SpoIIIJ